MKTFYILIEVILLSLDLGFLSSCASKREKDMTSCPKEYIDFIMNDSELCDTNSFNYDRYNLIYIDDDPIPEMVIDGRSEANGYKVLSLHDGKVCSLDTWRYYLTYIERSGLMGYSNGSMGHYYTHVFKVENGEFILILDWDKREEYNPEIFPYIGKLNGKPMDVEEADSIIELEYYSKGKVVSVDTLSWYSKKELLDKTVYNSRKE